MPDFLNPPKGLLKSRIIDELIATTPVRTRAAICSPRAGSYVQTEPHSPYSESFAICTALSSLS